MASAAQHNKLKYRALFCSSEDEEGPLSELQSPSPETTGWLSARFCDFPQEVILEFQGLSIISQIQVLSHQHNIACRVEFAVVETGGEAVVSSEVKSLAWKKLGHVSLDPNERSKYRARELKSVKINAQGDLLRIRAYRNHVNPHNLYNQVGIVAVNVIGQLPYGRRNPTDERRFEKHVPPSVSKYEDVAFDINFDPQTTEKIRELGRMKEQAVIEENYDVAKRYKNAIDHLTKVGGQIAVLETQKVKAVDKEDYDAAKRIKDEIERLRSEADSLARGQGVLPTRNTEMRAQPATKDPFGGVSQPEALMRAPSSAKPAPWSPAPQDQPEHPDSPGSHHTALSQHTHQSRHTAHTSATPVPYHEKLAMAPAADNLPFDERPAVSSGQQPLDEFPEDGPGGGGGGSGDADPEPLSQMARKKLGSIEQHFGSHIARCLFSKNWQLREKGLKLASDAIAKAANKSPMSSGCSDILVNFAEEKNASVFEAAMAFMSDVYEMVGPNLKSDGVDRFLTALSARTGDTHTRIKTATCDALLKSAGEEFIGCATVAHVLLAPVQKQSLWKPVVGKAGVLGRLIAQYGLGKGQGLTVDGVMHWCLAALGSEKGESRVAAAQVVAEVYRVQGDAVFKYTSKLKPAVQQMVQETCMGEKGNEVVAPAAAPKPAPARRSNAPAPVRTSNDSLKKKINSPKHSPKLQRANRNQANPGADDFEVKKVAIEEYEGEEEDEEDEESDECQFCGKQDETFLEEGQMDLHFWQECPLLGSCVECGQIIEISTMNEHLLMECDGMSNRKQCDRCQEAISAKDFEAHVKNKQCIPAKPIEEFNRCPLCHQDIPPEEEGWRTHLVEGTGCPANDRTRHLRASTANSIRSTRK